MAKKRQPSREEIEKEAAAELNRSMQRSLSQQRGYSSSSGSGYASSPPPAPSAPWDESGEAPGQYGQSRLSAAEEEEMVTEMALQQMAERRGGGRSIEDFAMSRMSPSQAEQARDRALREAVDRQARFAKPARRVPVPQQENRGFAGSWTSTSPSAESSKPMAWESAMPTRRAASEPQDDGPVGSRPAGRSASRRAPAKKASAKRAAPAKRSSTRSATPVKKKAPAKKGAPAKKAPAKRTPAKKAAPAKRAPAKKAAPAKRAPAKKVPAKRAASAKKAAPAKRAPAKRAPAKKAAGKKAAAGRATAARRRS